MKKKVLLTVNLKSGESFDFVIQIHKSEKPEELKMGTRFYQKNGVKLIWGEHYEMEWLLAPLKSKDYSHEILHIHDKANNHFLCWTEQIKEETQIKEIFKVFSLGMLYTFKTEKDLLEIFLYNDENIEKSLTDFKNILNVKSINVTIGGDLENDEKIKETFKKDLQSGKYNCFRKTICY